MIPALLKTSAKIKHWVSSGGVTGTALAKKYNISNSTTDYKIVLDDKNVKMVMITTRHNLHSKMIIDALEKDKHVFVEKPLSLDLNELTKINDVYEKNKGTLMVGYNRRFSPHIQKIKSLLGNSPMNIIATMNAGYIPPESWFMI